MTIDVFKENILTFSEAAKVLPRGRAGKKIHTCTLYRWASRGLRGIRLETIQVGGTTCTSQEALQRFFANLQEVFHPIQSHRIKQNQTRTNSIKEAERLLRTDQF